MPVLDGEQCARLSGNLGRSISTAIAEGMDASKLVQLIADASWTAGYLAGLAALRPPSSRIELSPTDDADVLDDEVES